MREQHSGYNAVVKESNKTVSSVCVCVCVKMDESYLQFTLCSQTNTASINSRERFQLCVFVCAIVQKSKML